MAKPVIAVIDAGYDSYVYERDLFEQAGYVFKVFEGEHHDVQGKIAFAKEAVGIMVRWTTMAEQTYPQFPQLKAILRYGVGFDNVDIPAAQGLGIRVANVQSYANHSVSDHALALLLALMERRLSALSEVEEWQYFYYYIALTPWFVVRTLLCLQWLAALGQRVRAAVIVCLVVMALGNLHSLYRCGQRMWSFRTLSAYADQMDRLRSAPPEPMSPQQARQALARCGAEPAYDRTLTNVSAQGWCERYNLLYWRILTRKLRRP